MPQLFFTSGIPGPQETGVGESVSAWPSELEVASSIPVSFHRRLFRLSSDPCSYVGLNTCAKRSVDGKKKLYVSVKSPSAKALIGLLGDTVNCIKKLTQIKSTVGFSGDGKTGVLGEKPFGAE